MALSLKPTHAAVKNYYAVLTQVGQLHFNNEAQVSDAFAKLLADCGRKLHLTFIPQFPIQRAKTRVIVDGALLDTFHLAHGYREAKDEKDDLDREIKAKFAKGYRSGYTAIASAQIPELHFGSSTDGFQCFPFYTYAEDGTHRRENITDWGLEQFRAHYHDPSITKWDIFHYIYSVLHHPEYRERYAANLRRELPRIPFAVATATTLSSRAEHERPKDGHAESRDLLSAVSTDAADKSIGPSARKKRGPQDDKEVFRAFATAGQRLAEIHVNYEQQPEYDLTKVEKKGEKLDYRVTKMKLSKDKTTLIYNQFLTLSGIPKKPTTAASATAPPWNGSSINTKSPPTSAAASPTIRIGKKTGNILCV
jgi:hypothetical protein